MKLYTNVLTVSDLMRALPPDIELLDGFTLHEGPRSRRWDSVRLCSLEPRGKGKNFHVNSGRHGAGSAYNATWDEHGLWMARLFDIDPRLKITGMNTYDGYMDFHRKTEWKYPTETCGDLTCDKCYTRKPAARCTCGLGQTHGNVGWMNHEPDCALRIERRTEVAS